MTPVLSIVICTYQRPAYLRAAIESVIMDAGDADGWEVLVVENGDGDVIRPLVGAFMRDHAAVRYTCEPTIGLSHARNRGWREAAGAYVHYLDDDILVVPGWMAAALRTIRDHAPHGYGGASYPLYTTPKPRWFRDEYVLESFYGDHARPLRADEFIFGMNMAFRRDVLEQVGGFDPAFGMTGEKIAYAEDLAVQDAIRAALPGAVLWYDPAISVSHVVRPEKMQWGWIVRQWWARGRYGYRIMARRFPPKHAAGRLRAVISSLLQVGHHGALMLWSLTGGIVRRDRARFPLPGHYVYERTMRHVKHIARYAEKARTAFKD
jgi:glycosyltransferase involved in cell wall biosynthesis